MLRTHQQEFKNIIKEMIIGRSSVKKIFVHVVPGGGKSMLPILAGKLITEGIADAICWIAPRLTLCHQAETNFLDPVFKNMLQHNLTIRSATNENNPCRGQNGFVTTYQAIGMDENQTVLRDFSFKRYILILDEWHHVEEGGVWHKALQPMVDKACFLIFLSGTLERGDGKKIAFLPYCNKTKNIFSPCLEPASDTAVINYNRETALKEKAILPLRFFLNDGQAKWQTSSGEEVSDSLSKRKADAGAAIYTALETEFAEELLKRGIDHWQQYKAYHNPRSKLLVVTANVAHAKKIVKSINQYYGLTSEIATSHDTPGAISAIKRFKSIGGTDILVSVAMIYEGFDCKELTHIISLTHIRSTPWILQEISRAVRIDPYAGPYGTQCGYIFAPDDYLMRKAIEKIESEQLATATEAEMTINAEKKPKEKDAGYGRYRDDIIPISSSMTDKRELEFGLFGDASFQDDPAPLMTIKETEEDILSKIEGHIRTFSFNNYYKPMKLNSEIKRAFNGKPRRDMTLRELKEVLHYVKKTYPLPEDNNKITQLHEKKEGVSQSRGSSRRVPVKPVQWQTKMFNI